MYWNKLLVTRFFLFCFYVGIFLQAQEQGQLSFQKIEKGLFNNWISSITQDRKGFIWVGTQDGLHRYDGYSFEVFRNSPEETESLAANWIRAVVTDPNENFWIGTHGGGLTKFSPKAMTFRNFACERANESAGKTVTQIITVDKNHILSATEKGFQIYDITTNTKRSLDLGYFDSPAASSGKLLWLAENQNLFTQNLKLDKKELVHTFDTKIQILEYIPEKGLIVGLKDRLILLNEGRIEKQLLVDESIISLTSNATGNYFLASTTSLFKFNPELFSLNAIQTDLVSSNKLIKTIFLDRQGSLWVGTDKGLYKEKKYSKVFLQDQIDLHARRIVKHQGEIYLGGENGLFRITGKTTSPLAKDLLITALFDNGETLVAGGTNAEIYRFMEDGSYSSIPVSEKFNKKMVIYGLTKDRRGRLWIGSWQGLHIFDQQEQKLNFIPLETRSKNEEAKIIDVRIDSKDRLWIITSALGIYMIESISDSGLEQLPSKIVNYRNIPGDASSITSNIIITIEEDEKGQMWFGTDTGVAKYLEETNDFCRLQYQGKVFDKKVMALKKDSKHNLWITTINDGIYVYNEEAKTTRHFTINEGLVSNAFLFGSGFYDETTDLMYFGTDEGVQKLDLAQPFLDQKDSTPLITAIDIRSEKGKNLVSHAQAPFLKKVSLASFQNDFSVRFSAMDFIAPEKINYVYSLDDTEWRMSDLQTAYFTNVAYGNHKLKIKALRDGIVHNKNVAELEIFIKPPWYYSLLAKIIYFFLVLAVVWGIYQYLKWRWKMQLDLKFKEEEAARLQKLNDFKSTLYTDIAHEFKTPLTLISGPIDSALAQGELSDFILANLSIVQRNTCRLTSLVDQLLELAKLEDGKLSMNISRGDLGLFLQTLCQSFEYQANQKNISYNVTIEDLR